MAQLASQVPARLPQQAEFMDNQELYQAQEQDLELLDLDKAPLLKFKEEMYHTDKLALASLAAVHHMANQAHHLHQEFLAASPMDNQDKPDSLEAVHHMATTSPANLVHTQLKDHQESAHQAWPHTELLEQPEELHMDRPRLLVDTPDNTEAQE